MTARRGGEFIQPVTIFSAISSGLRLNSRFQTGNPILKQAPDEHATTPYGVVFRPFPD
jgi:hypothetical protein